MINTTNNNNMNTIKCKVDNRWMRGLERACITILSPNGGRVTVDKWHMGKLTDSQRELVWKCYNSANQNNDTVELTIDEMKELVTIGNTAGSVYTPYKKKTPSLAQRKYMSWKTNQYKNTNKCGCGGNIIEKDHGTWIGWFCPKCKSGGSKSKNRKWR